MNWCKSRWQIFHSHGASQEEVTHKTTWNPNSGARSTESRIDMKNRICLKIHSEMFSSKHEFICDPCHWGYLSHKRTTTRWQEGAESLFIRLTASPHIISDTLVTGMTPVTPNLEVEEIKRITWSMKSLSKMLAQNPLWRPDSSTRWTEKRTHVRRECT